MGGINVHGMTTLIITEDVFETREMHVKPATKSNVERTHKVRHELLVSWLTIRRWHVAHAGRWRGRCLRRHAVRVRRPVGWRRGSLLRWRLALLQHC